MLPAVLLDYCWFAYILPNKVIWKLNHYRVLLMITRFYHLVARLLRLLPKSKQNKFGQMSANFFVPIYNHYICQDLGDIIARRREP